MRVVAGGALAQALPQLLGRPQRRGPLAIWTLGNGRIVALRNGAALENRLLGSDGNATLALMLAGDAQRQVVFDEWIHGYGEATGLAALPARWWVALAGLALAGLAWAIARGSRLGGADPREPAGAQPRGAYVEAMALALSRTSDVATLAARAHAAGERERDYERIRRP